MSKKPQNSYRNNLLDFLTSEKYAYAVQILYVMEGNIVCIQKTSIFSIENLPTFLTSKEYPCNHNFFLIKVVMQSITKHSTLFHSVKKASKISKEKLLDFLTSTVLLYCCNFTKKIERHYNLSILPIFSF